jgi:8-oxo-dGTP pyrophosphatase MutT (NUDIX family)
MAVVRQAGAIVFREDDGIVRVLLVRAKTDPALWIFPKGHIEAGESPPVTALRESFEESGATGIVVGPAGPRLSFRSGNDTIAVDYYLVSLTAEMPSPERRDKIWLVPEEAEERLVFQNARELLRIAVRRWQGFRAQGLKAQGSGLKA